MLHDDEDSGGAGGSCHNGGRGRKGEKKRKKQSERGRQTSHGELHANESETICKRAFISPGVKLRVGDADTAARVDG